jgi:large subunit ribosomal protein L22
MEVKAVSKYLRISPHKVRMMVDTLQGRPVQEALDALQFMPQKAAGLVAKVIRSALANADQREDVDVDTLVIQSILADQGPSLKRFRARARGRGTRILKRTSHITVVLAEKSA